MLLAGGDAAHAVLLGFAMAGFQVSIGAVNDLADQAADAVAKAWKPLPAGRLSTSLARAVALAGVGLGGALSAVVGLVPLLVGLLGWSLGMAYDLRLKRAGWGWLAFSLALPLVPVYAWSGAGAGLPPRLGVLIPLGALAGLQLSLANELVDLDADRAAHGRGLAVRLGRSGAAAAMLGAAVAVSVLAWLTLSAASMDAVALLAGATLLSLAGTAAAVIGAARGRWLGWGLQACGVALLALAWISGAAAA